MNRAILICNKTGPDSNQIQLERVQHYSWSLTTCSQGMKLHLLTAIDPITRQQLTSSSRFFLQAAKSTFWSKESCKKLRTRAYKARLQIWTWIFWFWKPLKDNCSTTSISLVRMEQLLVVTLPAMTSSSLRASWVEDTVRSSTWHLLLRIQISKSPTIWMLLFQSRKLLSFTFEILGQRLEDS